jgi:hypothetical protein
LWERNPVQWPSFDQLGRAVYDELQPILSMIEQSEQNTHLQAHLQGSIHTSLKLQHWLDAQCVVTVKLDGSNAGVDNMGFFYGRNTIIAAGTTYQKINVHSLLKDHVGKAEELRKTLQHALGLDETDVTQGLERVVLYGELCFQNKHDYVQSGVYRSWRCFGALATAFSKDEKAPLLLGGRLRTVGYNARAVGQGPSDNRILICLNAKLHDVFKELEVRTVATGYAPQSIDSSSWEEHGELPRFESLRDFLHSNWLRQFLMAPDTQLCEGVVVASEFDGTLFKLKHGSEKLGKVPEQLQEIVHTLRRFNGTHLQDIARRMLPAGILEVCEVLLEIATAKVQTSASRVDNANRNPESGKGADAEVAAAYESALTKVDDLFSTFSSGGHVAKAAAEQVIIEHVAADLEYEGICEKPEALRRATNFTLASVGKAYGEWKRQHGGGGSVGPAATAMSAAAAEILPAEEDGGDVGFSLFD